MFVNLAWQSGSSKIDVYRDGSHRATLDNIGSYIEKAEKNLKPSYIVCHFDSSNCSNAAIAAADGYIDPPKPDPLSRANRPGKFGQYTGAIALRSQLLSG